MNLKMPIAGTLGELMRQLEDLIARVNLLWGREHDDSGYHKVPSFVDITPSASMFVGISNQTFVVAVSATNPRTLMIKKSPSGDACTIAFEVSGTVGGTPSTLVRMNLPYGLIGKRQTTNTFVLNDGGNKVTGQAIVTQDGTTIDFYRVDEANFTGGTTSLRGELEFQVKNAR